MALAPSGLFKNAATKSADEPVATTQPVGTTTPFTGAGPQLGGWQYQNDPNYQAAMAAGESQFNLSRNDAKAGLLNQEESTKAQQEQLRTDSMEARRRLAGNFAARGMAGGAGGTGGKAMQGGAAMFAQARQNAEQIANASTLQQQMEGLNASFLSKYGADGSDWTGTLLGQQYKTSAIQDATTARLNQMGA